MTLPLPTLALAKWQENLIASKLARVDFLRYEVSRFKTPHKSLTRSLKDAEIEAGLALGRFAE